MKITKYYLFLFFITLEGSLSATYFGNGLKIGEVDQDSAIIWTRLTRDAEFNMQGHMWIEYEVPTERTNSSGTPRMEQASRMPEGATLNDMAFSLSGVAGEVRLIYWPHNDTSKVVEKDWIRVDPKKDHTTQIQINGLKPNTNYEVVLASRNPERKLGASVTGQFKTAPKATTAEEVTFTVVTCHDFGRRDDLANGHKIYPSMARVVKPDFMVHAGDIEYYDKADPWARSVELARHKWNRIFALPYQVDFYRQFASYFIKDDHDTLKNDAWPGENYGDLTWEQGLAIYREQVPIGKKTYRTIRWGKDLQIWMVEGRDFRSPNNIEDGPGKTIWGEEQKAWFFKSFAESDASFKVLISPTPIVGPDRGSKNDNHANEGFTWEGNQIREFMGKQKNAFVLCGDRHWQYASVDKKTGTREYSAGAGSNMHAGGYKMENREDAHKYLQIKGGFLGVNVKRSKGIPHISLTHYDVDGNIQNNEIFASE
ncbi:MAG: alkaline phosphatase D family protein [Verrucomicrobia bacterium]|nr:alkaline phosphatase D family protein [Verrucomicrobiota bacterium]MDA1068047.1 alkaline phosphatase D family protein [Verrucomicrobiota bacterium]